MELTRHFNELNKNHAHLAGGKGASLGEMTQAGIPVPPGFVVLSDSFEQFIRETDLIQEIDAVLSKVNHREIHTVEHASEQIKSLILAAEMPADIAEDIAGQFKKLDAHYVAVRSSATAEDGAEHAWAGQLESYLNTTEADLLDKVKHCWASLFTPRAIFYRFEKGLHTTKISVAVVVQKMVNSEASGIAFSVHPVTEDYNQLIIEAGFGLGEAIVSGSVTPNSYVVTKNPRTILDINIATQERGLYRVAAGGNEWKTIGEPQASSQVLNEKQILELSEIILNIEKHYGFPCDIEWAYEAGKFYVVQSRPITTLAKKVSSPKESSLRLDYSNYQQLFSTNSMSFLMSDISIHYYKKLRVMNTFAHNRWTSWMPTVKIQETLQEGLELFSDTTAFEKFQNDLVSHFDTSGPLFESILAGDSISEEQCRHMLEKMSETFAHYSKTEFFYVDEAFRKQDENPVIKNTIKKFEELKNESRVRINKLFFQPDSYRKQFMAKICKQFNLTKDQIASYGIDDLLALYKGIRLSDTVVQDRDRSYLMKGEGDSIQYIQGAASETIVNDFLQQAQNSDAMTLRGMVAYKGRVTAPATVIMFGNNMFSRLPEVIKNMPEGNVLVADTTAPEIFMACKKASAIITNQGGMMSHAAIVSRELKIPCIVGLGSATDKIKDGDMVEVDAEKGIVKIIK